MPETRGGAGASDPARPIRVCHLITRLELGGAQENTLHTVRTLRPPYRPHLISGRGGLLDAEARRLPGVEVTFVPQLVRPLRPWSDLRALWALTSLFRRLRPDIVHTHSSKAGVLGRVAAAAAGVPVVVHTVHGYGFNDEQPAPLRSLLAGMERLVAPVTTHTIAVSHANLERGIALGLIDPGRASIIRSGVEIEAFRQAAEAVPKPGDSSLRAELGVASSAPLVGMVACLKPQKAPLDFVETAVLVAAARPDTVFVIAGDGELRSAVERRVRERGLAGRFHLLGWRRDLPRVMTALDVVVLTSLWEGLPRVIPEAIAASRPVVATAVDGTAEILRDGENGFLCRPHDCDGMAARVLRLLNEPELGPRLAARALPILSEFDIDAMVRSQERLYENLLKGAAGERRALRAA